MNRVLFDGLHPQTVDVSDPALPPGTSVAEIRASLETALRDTAGRGWHAALCLIRPDETAAPIITRMLKADPCDCVVIGAGIRIPPASLGLLETVCNAVHRAAPNAAIAYNTHPQDTADAAAAARWLTDP